MSDAFRAAGYGFWKMVDGLVSASIIRIDR